MFAMNIMLAFAWTGLTGSMSWGNLFLGFILGYIVLIFVSRHQEEGEKKNYVKRVWLGIKLLIFFIKEVIVSNLRVTMEVITPNFSMTPGVIKVPLDAKTDLEITLLANMCTMTPGTVSLDVSEDRKYLYIHAMYIDGDAEALKKKFKDDFEARLLEVLR